MLNAYLRWGLVLTCATALAGCGDDDGAGPEAGQLTEPEAQALIEVIFTLGTGVYSPGAAASLETPSVETARLQLGSLPEETVIIDEQAYPCMGGGEVVVDGSMTYDSDQGWWTGYQMETRQEHVACRATSSNGQTFTLDGSPNIVMSWAVEASESTSDISGSWSGGVAWQTGSRSGVCSLDVSFDYTYTADGAFSGVTTGSVCGTPVDYRQ